MCLSLFVCMCVCVCTEVSTGTYGYRFCTSFIYLRYSIDIRQRYSRMIEIMWDRIKIARPIGCRPLAFAALTARLDAIIFFFPPSPVYRANVSLSIE